MTNFLIKHNSCVSKIARETDLEIKIAKNTETSLRKATRVIRTMTMTMTMYFYLKKNRVYTNFYVLQIAIMLI